MKPYILIFFLLVLGISSCKKAEELPEPVGGKPVLYLEGTANGKPFKFEAGANATFGAATVYKAVASGNDTLMSFSFRVDALDADKKSTYSFEVAINNYRSKTESFDGDLNNSIKTGEYSYIYTDVSSFPKYSFVPSQVNVLYSDHTIGHDYYSMTYWQSMRKFKILSVKDEYRNGKHYKVAEIDFDIMMKCMTASVPQYNIPVKAHGYVAFGLE